MKNAIKMLALDLDGTLALDDHQISPATKRGLQQLHNNEEVEVVIATGRRYRSTRYVADNLDFDVSIVCNGGALVKNQQHQTLQSVTFTEDQVQHLIKLGRSVGLSLSGQRDSHALGGPDFYIDNAEVWNKQAQGYFDDNAAYAEAADIQKNWQDILVIGAFDDEEKLLAFSKLVNEDSEGRFNTVIVPHLDSPYHYCEVSLSHITKWYGLNVLAQKNFITADNICAAGDQMNDYAMVQTVAHGVAMANGNDELKSIANFICGRHDEDGLLDVINYIRQHNQKHG